VVEKSKIEIVKDVAEKILEKVGMGAEVSVEETEDNEVAVDINGEDLGALIGYHGETLSSLQLFLNLALYRQTGEWRRVLVDIGGYRQEREQTLRELAQRTADRVRFLQTAATLNPMPSFERRLVHLALSEDETVETESTGEGWERRVVVKPVKTVTQ
jgi:spoIIIJ-associated protein